MSRKIVECIPNFSAARDKRAVTKIRDAIRHVPGVRVLDVESDDDHNRSVMTFVGTPEAAIEAAYQAIAAAAKYIDMDKHRGAHPRLGATDVVPFVPIQNMEMAEAVTLARALGQRVAETLQIPVYLYEEAATRPDRRNLENIRRGEYEGLQQRIATDPDRVPDFGPRVLGKAGATVIGARNPLIAFNVYLNTDDVHIAKRIARTIRYSSGGFRYVKAMGLLVEGQAQVSMNLTNFRKTPVHLVVETIRREAARYGAMISRSELIGLVPQDAILAAAKWYLQTDNLTSELVLENRLYGDEI